MIDSAVFNSELLENTIPRPPRAKELPREVERPELGPHSGTYGMGYKAVQPLLVSWTILCLSGRPDLH